MEKNTYNGWANYETWIVNLWMGNEPGSNEYWEGLALECMADAIEDEIGAESVKDTARNSLAERIRNEHETLAEELLPKAGFATDLMSASLSRVDWREIAEHYVYEIPVYCVGWNMPGYMPDSEPAMFLDFDEAQESLKESFESHHEDDEAISGEQIEEIIDGIDTWKETKGDWGFNFGQYFYWIVRN